MKMTLVSTRVGFSVAQFYYLSAGVEQVLCLTLAGVGKWREGRGISVFAMEGSGVAPWILNRMRTKVIK